MTDLTPPAQPSDTDQPTAGSGPDPSGDGAWSVLDDWRARIDDLRLQLELASMDARDEIRSRVETAGNAYLAARSRMASLRDQAPESDGVRRAVEEVVEDIRQAYEAAVAAVRRAQED